MAVPNPADNYVDINIDPEKFDPSRLSQGLECVLTVYSDIGLTRYNAQFSEFPYRINTGDWPAGVYIFNILFDGETYSLPVTINH